jgi:hypothetical protein
MLGIREPRHIGPDFREQDLRRALTDPRNGVQQGDGLLLGLQVLRDHSTDPGDSVIEVIDLAEGPRSGGNYDGA